MGNVFVTDQAHSRVAELPAGGGSAMDVPATGLNGPEGIAADSLGNIYIGDANNYRVVKISAAGVQTTVATGLSYTLNVAVDSGNNLFIADGGNNRILEIAAAGGQQTVVPLTGLSNPLGLAIDKTGNLFVADQGHNRVVELTWNGKSYSALKTFGTGLSNPQGVTIDKWGNLYIADWDNRRIVLLPAGGGNQWTVVTLPQQYPCDGERPVGLAADRAGNIVIADWRFDDCGSYQTSGWLEYFSLYGASVAWPAIGETQTASLGFSFSANTTLDSIAITSPGVVSPVFSVASMGTCTTSYQYGPGDSCTVNVNFAPAAAGVAFGSLAFTDSNELVAAQVFLNGIGGGPAVAFDPGTTTVLTVSNPSLASPGDAAVDAAGNVYIADFGNNRVLELPANGEPPIPVGSHLTGPAGVAVDGAGNSYIAETTGNKVNKVSVVGSVETTVGTGLSAPAAVAADAFGNVYIADSGNNRVLEIPVQGGKQVVVGAGLSNPAGLAIDSIGNIYIADAGHNRVVEVPVNGGVQSTVGSGLSNPHGVAVDGALNVYIDDTGNNRLVMVPSGGGGQIVLAGGLKQPGGLSVDAFGNLYLADTGNNRVLKIDRASAPSLAFAAALPGKTSSDSPKSVAVRNIGTQKLDFDSSWGVAIDPGDNDFYFLTNSGDCQPGTELNKGTSCSIPIYFAPDQTGYLTGMVILTDDALNSTGSTQAIDLSGWGATPAPILASLSATSAPVAGAAFTMTLKGSNFVKGSTAEWSGAKLATKFGSASQLSASIPAADLAKAGAFQVTVVNPAPYAGPSNALTFNVGQVSAADSPVFSPGTGTYTSVQTVTIADATPGATIYYAINATPTTSATRYTSAITVSASETLEAIAVAANYAQSPVATAAYTVKLPVAALSEGSVAFGSQKIGTASGIKTVTLTNTGNATLTFGSIELTGPNLSSFFMNDSCGTSLAAGSSCQIVLLFYPMAAGAKSAAVTIVDNSANSPQTIQLTGTGQ
jgi:sugar lactone lactonase YvrE